MIISASFFLLMFIVSVVYIWT